MDLKKKVAKLVETLGDMVERYNLLSETMDAYCYTVSGYREVEPTGPTPHKRKLSWGTRLPDKELVKVVNFLISERRFMEYCHPDSLENLVALRKALKAGKPFRSQLHFRTPEGGELWVLLAAKPVLKDGRLFKMHALFKDLTRQKKLEVLARQREDRLRRNELAAIYLKTLELTHPALARHALRVEGLCLELAAYFNLEAQDRDTLSLAARLHEMGKLALPERLRVLNAEEVAPQDLAEYQTYPIKGQALLAEHASLAQVGEIIAAQDQPITGGGRQSLVTHILSAANECDSCFTSGVKRKRITRRFLAAHGTSEDLEADEKLKALKAVRWFFEAKVDQDATKGALDPDVCLAMADLLAKKEQKALGQAAVAVSKLAPGMVLAQPVRRGRELIYFSDQPLSARVIELLNRALEAGSEVWIKNNAA